MKDWRDHNGLKSLAHEGWNDIFQKVLIEVDTQAFLKTIQTRACREILAWFNRESKKPYFKGASLTFFHFLAEATYLLCVSFGLHIMIGGFEKRSFFGFRLGLYEQGLI